MKAYSDKKCLGEKYALSDAEKKNHADILNALDRKYGDAAKELLKKWEYFKENITDYEEKAEDVIDRAEEIEEQMEGIEDIDFEEASEEEMEVYDEASSQVFDQAIDSQTVAIGVYLELKN